MRIIFLLLLASVFITACDENRLYEKNISFENRQWMQVYKPEFEFVIADNTVPYNLYLNVRNSIDYPYSRIFITYRLQDSLGMVLDKKLINNMLFDPRTGKPEGTSGLGDIYDHQFPIKMNHKFPYAGKHKISLEHFMRTDSLTGILAVGVRVEKIQTKP